MEIRRAASHGRQALKCLRWFCRELKYYNGIQAEMAEKAYAWILPFPNAFVRIQSCSIYTLIQTAPMCNNTLEQLLAQHIGDGISWWGRLLLLCKRQANGSAQHVYFVCSHRTELGLFWLPIMNGKVSWLVPFSGTWSGRAIWRQGGQEANKQGVEWGQEN